MARGDDRSKGTRTGAAGDPVALRHAIERAFERASERNAPSDPREVLPMLERLRYIAQEGSAEARFADRRLAEILLESDTWRAAMHVRRLLREDASDDAHWALMGLAQALLGNHRFASSCYRQAIALDPGNPWYAHNLGHLLDVALDKPREALPLLSRAHARVRDAVPIACSYAHALFRTGDLKGARKIIAPLAAARGTRDPDVAALAIEIENAEAKAARAKRPRRAPSRRSVDALEIEALLALRADALTLDRRGLTRARIWLERGMPLRFDEIDAMTAAAALLAHDAKISERFTKKNAVAAAKKLEVDAEALSEAVHRLVAARAGKSERPE